MRVIRVTKLNEDGSVAFDGLLGPNEVQYLLENGLNAVMQAGVEYIEQIGEEVEEEENLIPGFPNEDENPPSRH